MKDLYLGIRIFLFVTSLQLLQITFVINDFNFHLAYLILGLNSLMLSFYLKMELDV